MINLNDCIELGFISKPHGVKGNLILNLKGISFDNILEMELVFIIVDGLPVPFFISEFQERTNDSLIINLEDVNSEEEARKLCGLSVYINNAIISDDTIEDNSSDSLKGYTVSDEKEGFLGILDSILDFDLNPVFNIKNGNKEVLIPFQKEFILKIDHQKKEIIVLCPEGLLDIYL